jgi:hypothetical protein
MRTYIFRLLLPRGVCEVSISASGYFAAENAVRSMYPDATILGWR